MKPRPWAVAGAVVLGAATAVVSTGALAQSATDTKKEIEQLQRELQVLKDRLDKQEAEQKAQAAKAAAAPPQAAAPGQHEFLERKPGNNFTLFTRGGEVSIYGNLDMSIDNTTKGIGGMTNDAGAHPVGNVNHMTAISTNISYIGLRGFQTVGTAPFDFVYQLETALDLSVVSGDVESNSNQSNSVRAGLTSRNTYMGVASPKWGALKIGKTDTPYKTSTARMNPFSGTIGDYSAIMGNTGGDNRNEFGIPRMEHSLWYESPKLFGVNFNFLFSPGQNRAYDSSNIASGSGDCAGGNVPGSGGTPEACNDGSFSNAISTNLAYTGIKNLYATIAFESHKKVNRTSDLAVFNQDDVADEDARKIGLQYHFPTRTTVSAIWEDMRRHVPAYLDVQNERTRTGYWFAVSQEITAADSVHFGWGHANKAVGDPGQHNAAGVDAFTNAEGITGFPHVDNSANLLTALFRHRFDRNFSVYADWATTINHRYGHYDMGAGGRGVTTDCHDGSNPDASGFDPNGGAPHCWAGGHLTGFSVGMDYRF